MNSHIFTIKDKHKPEFNSIASKQDFLLGSSLPFCIEDILEDDNITLYALDFATKEVIFVQTEAGINIYEYPFFYQAQYRFAQSVITVSFNDIIQLPSDFDNGTPFIFLHSVGRCGSTLLYRILDCSTELFSISEPDLLSQLVALKNHDRENDQLIISFLQTFLPLILKKNIRQSPEITIPIKTHSFSIEIADLFQEAFPNSTNFFLYRNAHEVVLSSVKAFGEALQRKQSIILENIELYSCFFHLLSQFEKNIIHSNHFPSSFFAIAWLSGIEIYLKLFARKVISFAVRYGDLFQETEITTYKICRELLISPIVTQDIKSVMLEDSQLGSNLAQSALSHKTDHQEIRVDELLNNIDKLISLCDFVDNFDVLLPGTLSANTCQ